MEYKALFSDRIKLPKMMFMDRFPTLIFDQSKSKLVIHENFSVRGELRMLFHNNGILEIKAGTFFNNNCSVNCLEKIEIGNNCLFGEGVKIYDHNHKYKDSEVLIKDQGYTSHPVVIGDNCWIGSNVTILKGARIGDNCIIGANCLIYKEVPSGTVVVADGSLSKTNNI